MLMAAKQRKPVNAFSRAGLRISTGSLDVSGQLLDAAGQLQLTISKAVH